MVSYFLFLVLLQFSGGASGYYNFVEVLEEPVTGIRAKRQLLNTTRKWPNGVVYYDYDSSISPEKIKLVIIATNLISKDTCIKFERNTKREGNYILFVNSTGCSSRLGMAGKGEQTLQFSDRCMDYGSVIHELMHSMGISHTVSRYDRDKFVNVKLANNSHAANFNLRTDKDSYIAVPYEYGSVMHYSHKAGGTVLIPKEAQFLYTMGNLRISFYDMVNINVHYSCGCEKKLACANGGYTNPSDCKTCICPSGYGGNLCYEFVDNEVEELHATNQWQDYSRTFQAPKYYSGIFIHYETLTIHAPKDRPIQVEITEMKGFEKSYGCNENGVEIKYMGDPRITNPLHCSSANVSLVYTGKLNPMPIILYTKTNKTSTFGFRYRYADFWLSDNEMGTNGYDDYQYLL